jgi:hypothetical protein
MPSPFHYDKKTRRRYRKLAKRLGNEEILAKWDAATVESIKGTVAIIDRQAKAKRRKKRLKIQP